MENKWLVVVVTMAMLVFLSSSVLPAIEPDPSAQKGEGMTKKPLAEVFNNVVVIPFDYHGKVFLNGQKTDVYGDYKLYERKGRVLVPIRLMGYLAAKIDGNNGYWKVDWDPQKPDDVLLINYNFPKTVRLTVNSKTMYINNEPQTLDVPPQRIENRIVLPLRSVSEALNKNIAWLDGLIIISNDLIDLQSPQTLEIKDKIKARLADRREKPDYENSVTPITKYGDTVYYVKNKYNSNGTTQELYKKTGSKPEVKIELPGEKQFNHCKVINNELFYISTINGKSELSAFNFAASKSRKLCALGQWHPDDGWLGEIKYINGELYIVLHTGDLTMGYERLYKLEDGQLKEIAGAKSFISFDVAGDYLYYTVFAPMVNEAGNLFRVNLMTGEEENLGEENFAYDIFRTVEDNGGISLSCNNSCYIKDGYIYTLGYKQDDSKDKCCVYKVGLDGNGQKKLTEPVRAFWLVDNKVYYIDLSTGNLDTVDLEGNATKILVDKGVIDAQFFNGNIYYTAGTAGNGSGRLGKLYKYNISCGQDIKLSNQPVSQFFAGKAGVYYKAEGYELGLYKIAGGKSFCLVDDTIDTLLYTDYGMVYTLRYVEGIYSIK